jgi:hypothetical protein
VTAASFPLVRFASLAIAVLVVLALAVPPAYANRGGSRARAKPAAAKPNKPAKETRSQTRTTNSRRATNERAARSFARSADRQQQQGQPPRTRGRLFKAVAGGLVALGLTVTAAMSFMSMHTADAPGGDVMTRPPSVTAPQPVEDIRPGGPGTTFNPSVDWGGARR